MASLTRNNRNNSRNNHRNTPVEIAIQKTIQDIIPKPFKTIEKYLLTFSFNDKIYQIQFDIRKSDDSIIIHNKCIALSYKLRKRPYRNGVNILIDSTPHNSNIMGNTISNAINNDFALYAPINSFITKNTPSNKCFNPVLSPETLPDGITQTDILQVLSTKLKSLIAKNKLIKITDVASLNYSVLYLSLWRLLRGELSLYEKYGYISKSFTAIRETAKHVPYEATSRDSILYDNLHTHFPYVFNSANNTKSIAELMKHIPYDSVNVSNVDCITDLFRFIALVAGFPALMTTAHEELTLNTKTSEVWRKWNRRITLLDWVRI